MTIKECYEKMHGNYDEALQRLMNDKLVERFILKFTTDNSINLLRDAVKAGDTEAAFQGAHMLKGVAANLAFTELREAVSELTESLRGSNEPVNMDLFDKVEEKYKMVIDAIMAYEQEKQ